MPLPGPTMDDAFSWNVFLSLHRDRILEEWQERLHTNVSAHYVRRPRKELAQTTATNYAFCQVLRDNDYTRINHFISEITRI
ncbi:MAG: hypothetical protein U5K27_10080 [Desulfotignum sp.]|nr:hypothetical protein [Desulfotignum sp.]